MTKADLAESIIKPAATMAPSWVNLIMKDGTELPGTIVSEINGEITIHNIAGIPSTVKAADVLYHDRKCDLVVTYGWCTYNDGRHG